VTRRIGAGKEDQEWRPGDSEKARKRSGRKARKRDEENMSRRGRIRNVSAEEELYEGAKESLRRRGRLGSRV
jgi:hypothetical protein